MKVARRKQPRCPACGQRFESSSDLRCSICGFTFADDRITGADVTPYAKAYSLHEPGWRRMCEWSWFAGTERIKHLMLMRASAASRRFARINVLLLAFGLAMTQGARWGWRWVSNVAAIEETGSTQPLGTGWVHVAAAPRPLPAGQPGELFVDLWWNPIQGGIAWVMGLCAALLLIGLILGLLRWGVEKAHHDSYRGEQRMTAAFHYASAWYVPIVLGTAVVALRPIAYVGAMARWSWVPPDRGFVLSGAVLVGVGFVCWWFWLARLGSVSPAKTRGRVTGFLVAAVPALVAGFGGAWWLGLDWVYNRLFSALRLSF